MTLMRHLDTLDKRINILKYDFFDIPKHSTLDSIVTHTSK